MFGGENKKKKSDTIEIMEFSLSKREKNNPLQPIHYNPDRHVTKEQWERNQCLISNPKTRIAGKRRYAL